MPQSGQCSCYRDTEKIGNSSSRCHSLTQKQVASEKTDWGPLPGGGSVDNTSEQQLLLDPRDTRLSFTVKDDKAGGITPSWVNSQEAFSSHQEEREPV